MLFKSFSPAVLRVIVVSDNLYIFLSVSAKSCTNISCFAFIFATITIENGERKRIDYFFVRLGENRRASLMGWNDWFGFTRWVAPLIWFYAMNWFCSIISHCSLRYCSWLWHYLSSTIKWHYTNLAAWDWDIILRSFRYQSNPEPDLNVSSVYFFCPSDLS